MPLVQIYWKICRPKTYGVKVLIKNRQKPSQILLVRHTYGDTSLWNIPGGGYNPKKETPIEAGLREISEELGVMLQKIVRLGKYKTTGEGKRDTVVILSGILSNSELTLNDEIVEAKWVEMTDVKVMKEISKVAMKAVSLL